MIVVVKKVKDGWLIPKEYLSGYKDAELIIDIKRVLNPVHKLKK